MEKKFNKGDRVQFTTQSAPGTMTGTYNSMGKNGYAQIKGDDNKGYQRQPSALKLIGEAPTSIEITGAAVPAVAQSHPTKVIDINKKFEYLSLLIGMVVDGTMVSAIVTGEGGLGKTFTVLNEVKKRGWTKTDAETSHSFDEDYSRFDDADDSDADEIQGKGYKKVTVKKNETFVHIKGFSTPRGLYRMLFENNGKLIIFDDCDEVLKNDVAKNLMKSALDSYDERELHWIVKTEDESLPSSFIFDGRIIFISNMSQDKIDGAIISRSVCIDLSMSVDDRIKRMYNILPAIMPEVSVEVKTECMNLIEDNKRYINDLNFRTLIKVIKVRTSQPAETWVEMAEYMMMN